MVSSLSERHFMFHLYLCHQAMGRQLNLLSLECFHGRSRARGRGETNSRMG